MRAWFSNLSGPKKLATGLVAVAAGISAVIGVVTGGFTILTWFVPSIQPPPPSIEGEATLSKLEAVPDVTLGESFQWPGMPAKGEISQASKEERQRLGTFIIFDLELKGFAGDTLTLRWSVYDADTGKPVAELTDQPAWPTHHVRPRHDVSRSQLETWVPYPRSSDDAFWVALDVYATLAGEDTRIDSEKIRIKTPEKRTAETEAAGPGKGSPGLILPEQGPVEMPEAAPISQQLVAVRKKGQIGPFTRQDSGFDIADASADAIAAGPKYSVPMTFVHSDGTKLRVLVREFASSDDASIDLRRAVSRVQSDGYRIVDEFTVEADGEQVGQGVQLHLSGEPEVVVWTNGVLSILVLSPDEDHALQFYQNAPY